MVDGAAALDCKMPENDAGVPKGQVNDVVFAAIQAL
jgi:hypothetical protein